MLGKKIDPKLAKSIEDDMADIDGDKPKTKTTAPAADKATVAVDCPTCGGSGLIDPHTHCNACDATGKILAAEG